MDCRRARPLFPSVRADGRDGSVRPVPSPEGTGTDGSDGSRDAWRAATVFICDDPISDKAWTPEAQEAVRQWWEGVVAERARRQ